MTNTEERVIVQLKIRPSYLDLVRKEAAAQKISPAEVIEQSLYDRYLITYPDVSIVNSLEDVRDGKCVYRVDDPAVLARLRSRLYKQANRADSTVSFMNHKNKRLVTIIVNDGRGVEM